VGVRVGLPDLPIHQQHLGHLAVKRRVALLQAVAHRVRLRQAAHPTNALKPGAARVRDLVMRFRSRGLASGPSGRTASVPPQARIGSWLRRHVMRRSRCRQPAGGWQAACLFRIAVDPIPPADSGKRRCSRCGHDQRRFGYSRSLTGSQWRRRPRPRYRQQCRRRGPFTFTGPPGEGPPGPGRGPGSGPGAYRHLI
jgi:hypothetical protein